MPEAGQSQFRKEEGSCDQSFCLSSELIADPPHFRDLYSEASGPSAWSETSGREDPAVDRRQNGKYPAASQAERRAGHQQTSWKGRPDGKKAEWSAGARAICSKSQGRAAGRRRRREWQLQHLKLILCDHLVQRCHLFHILFLFLIQIKILLAAFLHLSFYFSLSYVPGRKK